MDAYHVSMRRDERESVCEATIKVRVNGQTHQTVAEGDGPVNALDGALRLALANFFPRVKKVTLTDYKVRILEFARRHRRQDPRAHPIQRRRREWGTVGVSRTSSRPASRRWWIAWNIA